MSDLRERLEAIPVPGEHEARERAIALARAELRAAGASPPGHRRRGLMAGVLATLAVGGAVLTPPGAAVADWIRDVVREDTPTPHTRLGTVPGRGRVLAVAPGGTWIVEADGSRRRLGPFDDATWSPQGLFVAAARGRQLVAVDPRGGVRWSLSAAADVRDPRWAAPDGFRIAYRAGDRLRVVFGDGSSDRLLDARVAPVPPAWLPRPGRRLAYADADGSVRLVATATRRTLWRNVPDSRVVALDWSRDGGRLLVADRTGARLLDVRGRTVARAPATPRGAIVTTAALAPDGRGIAVAWRDPASGAATVAVDGRALFTAGGRIASLTWSPDGQRLLAAWPEGDQWLFLSPRRGARTISFGRVATQLDPAAPRPRGFPRVAGWCCVPAT